MASTPQRACRPRCGTSACRCEPQQQHCGAEARLPGSEDQRAVLLWPAVQHAVSCIPSACAVQQLLGEPCCCSSSSPDRLLFTKPGHSNPPSATLPPAVGGHLSHQLPDDCLCGARGLPAGLAVALLAAPAVPGGRLPRPLHPHVCIGAESLPGAAAAAWGALGRRGRACGPLGAGERQGVGWVSSSMQAGLWCPRAPLSSLQPWCQRSMYLCRRVPWPSHLSTCLDTVYAGRHAGGCGDHRHPLFCVPASAGCVLTALSWCCCWLAAGCRFSAAWLAGWLALQKGGAPQYAAAGGWMSWKDIS